MIFTSTGPIARDVYICGLSAYPVHLLDCARPVLFDGGVTCGGALYAEAIRSVLGARQPEILFISHVHWDHCGAIAYLKRAFPSLKIAASRQAADIMKRPRARALMAELNEGVRPVVASFPEVDTARLLTDPFEPFEIDMIVEDGETIRLSEDATVQVLATPGHTRDHMSYFIPGRGILVAAEASGCLDSANNIVTQFLVDFDIYFSSLTRLASLPVEVLCQGHRIVFIGRGEVEAFFTLSISESIRFRDRVNELLHEEAGSVERVVARVKEERYDTVKGVKQPEGPYLLNLTAQVANLAQKAHRP